MRLVTLAALVVLAAGCGGGEPRVEPAPPPPAAGVPAPGGGLSVGQALAATSEEPLLVRGALLVEGRVARLCSGFAESHPPQCVEPSLALEGLVLAAVKRLLRREGAVRWSDEPFRVIGTVEGRTLIVVSTAQ